MWALNDYYNTLDKTFRVYAQADEPLFSDDEFTKIAEEIFKGMDVQIPEELYLKTVQKISEGVSQGYGSIGYDTKDISMVYQLKNNAAVFSAFKANHQASAMRELLVDEKGEKRSWPSFSKEALKLNPTYNQAWLEAEFNMAIRQARSAEQWQDFEKNKDLYPNLEYMPSRSANPSDTHRPYYGMIASIDDPIWDTLMPPSRWGCKCWVQSTREGVVTKDVVAPEPMPGIAGNAGKSGMVFSATHEYIASLSKQEKKIIQSEFNKLKELKNEVIIAKSGKNAIKVSVNADPNDLKHNVDFATSVSKKFKKDIEIRPHTNEQNAKNPEFEFMKTIGDLYAWKKAATIEKYVDKAFKHKFRKDEQLSSYSKAWLGLDMMGKFKASDIEMLVRRLKAKFMSNPTCKFVIIKNNDKTVMIKSEKFDFTKALQEIKKELL